MEMVNQLNHQYPISDSVNGSGDARDTIQIDEDTVITNTKSLTVNGRTNLSLTNISSDVHHYGDAYYFEHYNTNEIKDKTISLSYIDKNTFQLYFGANSDPNDTAINKIKLSGVDIAEIDGDLTKKNGNNTAFNYTYAANSLDQYEIPMYNGDGELVAAPIKINTDTGDLLTYGKLIKCSSTELCNSTNYYTYTNDTNINENVVPKYNNNNGELVASSISEDTNYINLNKATKIGSDISNTSLITNVNGRVDIGTDSLLIPHTRRRRCAGRRPPSKLL